MYLVPVVTLVLLAAMQVLFVSGVAVTVPSIESNNDDLPYPLVVGTVSGEVKGIKYSLNGTLDSVLLDLKKQYPDLKMSDFDTASGDHLSGSDTASTLQKRNMIWPPSCYYNGYRWKTTNSKWVYALAEDLERDRHRRFGVAGRSCAYMGCNFDAQAYLCNDRNDYVEPSVPYLASYIRAACGYNPCKYRSIIYGWQCGGQVFDTDNYNVIVRRRDPNDSNVCLSDVKFGW